MTSSEEHFLKRKRLSYCSSLQRAPTRVSQNRRSKIHLSRNDPGFKGFSVEECRSSSHHALHSSHYVQRKEKDEKKLEMEIFLPANLSCLQCSLVFSSNTHLIRHIKFCYNPTLMTGNEESLTEIENLLLDEQSGMLICPWCPVLCASLHGLRKHLPQCRERCRQRFERTIVPNFPCPECQFVFQKLVLVLQHVRTHYVGNLLCHPCNKEFESVKGLSRHLKNCGSLSHHKCSDCGKYFSNVKRFQSHLWHCKHYTPCLKCAEVDIQRGSCWDHMTMHLKTEWTKQGLKLIDGMLHKIPKNDYFGGKGFTEPTPFATKLSLNASKRDLELLNQSSLDCIGSSVESSNKVMECIAKVVPEVKENLQQFQHQENMDILHSQNRLSGANPTLESPSDQPRSRRRMLKSTLKSVSMVSEQFTSHQGKTVSSDTETAGTDTSDTDTAITETADELDVCYGDNLHLLQQEEYEIENEICEPDFKGVFKSYTEVSSSVSPCNFNSREDVVGKDSSMPQLEAQTSPKVPGDDTSNRRDLVMPELCKQGNLSVSSHLFTPAVNGEGGNELNLTVVNVEGGANIFNWDDEYDISTEKEEQIENSNHLNLSPIPFSSKFDSTLNRVLRTDRNEDGDSGIDGLDVRSEEELPDITSHAMIHPEKNMLLGKAISNHSLDTDKHTSLSGSSSPNEDVTPKKIVLSNDESISSIAHGEDHETPCKKLPRKRKHSVLEEHKYAVPKGQSISWLKLLSLRKLARYNKKVKPTIKEDTETKRRSSKNLECEIKSNEQKLVVEKKPVKETEKRSSKNLKCEMKSNEQKLVVEKKPVKETETRTSKNLKCEMKSNEQKLVVEKKPVKETETRTSKNLKCEMKSNEQKLVVKKKPVKETEKRSSKPTFISMSDDAFTSPNQAVCTSLRDSPEYSTSSNSDLSMSIIVKDKVKNSSEVASSSCSTSSLVHSSTTSVNVVSGETNTETTASSSSPGAKSSGSIYSKMLVLDAPFSNMKTYHIPPGKNKMETVLQGAQVKEILAVVPYGAELKDVLPFTSTGANLPRPQEGMLSGISSIKPITGPFTLIGQNILIPQTSVLSGVSNVRPTTGPFTLIGQNVVRPQAGMLPSISSMKPDLKPIAGPFTGRGQNILIPQTSVLSGVSNVRPITGPFTLIGQNVVRPQVGMLPSISSMKPDLKPIAGPFIGRGQNLLIPLTSVLSGVSNVRPITGPFTLIEKNVSHPKANVSSGIPNVCPSNLVTVPCTIISKPRNPTILKNPACPSALLKPNTINKSQGPGAGLQPFHVHRKPEGRSNFPTKQMHPERRSNQVKEISPTIKFTDIVSLPSTLSGNKDMRVILNQKSASVPDQLKDIMEINKKKHSTNSWQRICKREQSMLSHGFVQMATKVLSEEDTMRTNSSMNSTINELSSAPSPTPSYEKPLMFIISSDGKLLPHPNCKILSPEVTVRDNTNIAAPTFLPEIVSKEETVSSALAKELSLEIFSDVSLLDESKFLESNEGNLDYITVITSKDGEENSNGSSNFTSKAEDAAEKSATFQAVSSVQESKETSTLLETTSFKTAEESITRSNDKNDLRTKEGRAKESSMGDLKKEAEEPTILDLEAHKVDGKLLPHPNCKILSPEVTVRNNTNIAAPTFLPEIVSKEETVSSALAKELSLEIFSDVSVLDESKFLESNEGNLDYITVITSKDGEENSNGSSNFTSKAEDTAEKSATFQAISSVQESKETSTLLETTSFKTAEESITRSNDKNDLRTKEGRAKESSIGDLKKEAEEPTILDLEAHKVHLMLACCEDSNQDRHHPGNCPLISQATCDPEICVTQFSSESGDALEECVATSSIPKDGAQSHTSHDSGHGSEETITSASSACTLENRNDREFPCGKSVPEDVIHPESLHVSDMELCSDSSNQSIPCNQESWSCGVQTSVSIGNSIDSSNKAVKSEPFTEVCNDVANVSGRSPSPFLDCMSAGSADMDISDSDISVQEDLNLKRSQPHNPSATNYLKTNNSTGNKNFEKLRKYKKISSVHFRTHIYSFRKLMSELRHYARKKFGRSGKSKDCNSALLNCNYCSEFFFSCVDLENHKCLKKSILKKFTSEQFDGFFGSSGSQLETLSSTNGFVEATGKEEKLQLLDNSISSLDVSEPNMEDEAHVLPLNENKSCLDNAQAKIEYMSNIPSLGSGLSPLEIVFSLKRLKKKCLFICKVCQSRFKSFSGLVDHKRTAHSELTSLKCHVCGKEFSNLQKLAVHFAKTHKTTKKREEKVSGNESPVEKTGRDETTFEVGFGTLKLRKDAESKKAVLSQTNDKRTNSENEDSCCKICNKVFNGRSGLRSHISQAHGARFKCPVCSRKFIHLSKMKIHYFEHFPYLSSAAEASQISQRLFDAIKGTRGSSSLEELDEQNGDSLNIKEKGDSNVSSLVENGLKCSLKENISDSKLTSENARVNLNRVKKRKRGKWRIVKDSSSDEVQSPEKSGQLLNKCDSSNQSEVLAMTRPLVLALSKVKKPHYKCDDCHESFKRHHHLAQHRLEAHQRGSYLCTVCHMEQETLLQFQTHVKECNTKDVSRGKEVSKPCDSNMGAEPPPPTCNYNIHEITSGQEDSSKCPMKINIEGEECKQGLSHPDNSLVKTEPHQDGLLCLKVGPLPSISLCDVSVEDSNAFKKEAKKQDIGESTSSWSISGVLQANSLCKNPKNAVEPSTDNSPASEVQLSFLASENLTLTLQDKEGQERRKTRSQALSYSLPHEQCRTRVSKSSHAPKALWKCQVCLRDFRSKRFLQRHNIESHGASCQFRCPFCKKIFLDLKTLQSHHKRKHTKKKWMFRNYPHNVTSASIQSEPSAVPSCLNTELKQTSDALEPSDRLETAAVPTSLNSHKIAEHTAASPLQDSSESETVLPISDTINPLNPTQSCTKVKRTISGSSSGSCTSLKKSRKCKHCGKTFKRGIDLKRHYREKHHKRPIVIKHKPVSSNDTSTSDQPPVEVLSSNFEQQHESSQLSQVSEKLESVINTSCDETDVFKCNDCPLTYKKFSCLKRHRILMHAEPASHYCNICGKGFSYPHSLKAHMMSHSRAQCYTKRSKRSEKHSKCKSCVDDSCTHQSETSHHSVADDTKLETESKKPSNTSVAHDSIAKTMKEESKEILSAIERSAVISTVVPDSKEVPPSSKSCSLTDSVVQKIKEVSSPPESCSLSNSVAQKLKQELSPQERCRDIEANDLTSQREEGVNFVAKTTSVDLNCAKRLFQEGMSHIEKELPPLLSCQPIAHPVSLSEHVPPYSTFVNSIPASLIPQVSSTQVVTNNISYQAPWNGIPVNNGASFHSDFAMPGVTGFAGVPLHKSSWVQSSEELKAFNSCSVCGLCLPSWYALQEHYHISHSTPNFVNASYPAQQMYPRLDCHEDGPNGWQIPGRSSVQPLTMAVSTPSTEMSNYGSSSQKLSTQLCSVCGLFFPSLPALQQHYITHMAEPRTPSFPFY